MLSYTLISYFHPASRWSKDLADKDLLVANTIPYLVSYAVSDLGTVSFIFGPPVNKFASYYYKILK